jgi:hypothetical protein
VDNGSVVARTVAGRSLEGGADRRPGPACQIRTRWGGVPGVVRWTGTRGKHLLLRQVSLRELINKRRPVSPPPLSSSSLAFANQKHRAEAAKYLTL